MKTIITIDRGGWFERVSKLVMAGVIVVAAGTAGCIEMPSEVPELESRLKLETLTLSDDSITAGESVTGTIVLSDDEAYAGSGSSEIELTADLGSVMLPAGPLSMAEGTSTLSFEVKTQPVTKRTVATLYAKMSGQVALAKLTLIPGTEVAFLSVEMNESGVEEPTSQLTVHLRAPAPPEGVLVHLASSDPGLLSIPDQVEISEGEVSATIALNVSTEAHSQLGVFAYTDSLGDEEPSDISWASVIPPRTFAPSERGTESESAERQFGITIPVSQSPESFDIRRCLDGPYVFSVGQDILTDGSDVNIFGSFPGTTTNRVILRGYRYREAPVFDHQRNLLDPGERDCIHCSCRSVVIIPQDPNDDVNRSESLLFTLPNNLPSGEYEIVVLPAGPCPEMPGTAMPEQLDQGSFSCSACANFAGCQSVVQKIFVLPSFVTSIWNTLDVKADSEETNDRPAELSFVFAGFAGSPPVSDPESFPVSLAGSYPAIVARADYVTAHDRTLLKPDVPVFVGRQDRMDFAECLEESVATLAAQQTRSECDRLIASDYPSTRSITIGGLERDCSGGDCSNWWDEAAEIGAFALGCGASIYVGQPAAGCRASKEAASWIGDQVNKIAAGDDDKLGAFEDKVNRGSPPNWGAGSTTSKTLYGGYMPVGIAHRRVGGPRVLNYKVTLKNVQMRARYDERDKESNVFVQARAVLVTDQTRDMPDSDRYPALGELKVRERNDRSYPSLGLNWIIAQQSFPVSQAPNAPLLYVEISVWDNDPVGEEYTTGFPPTPSPAKIDHVGIHSRTFVLQDFMLGGSEIIQNGRAVRRVNRTITSSVTGCTRTACRGVAYGTQGADITYEVEVSWLKHDAD